MPAGALAVMWVPQEVTTLPQYSRGWNFVALADIATMVSANAVRASGGGGAVPARYLPMPVMDPHTPVVRVATPPPGRPSAP